MKALLRYLLTHNYLSGSASCGTQQILCCGQILNSALAVQILSCGTLCPTAKDLQILSSTAKALLRSAATALLRIC